MSGPQPQLHEATLSASPDDMMTPGVIVEVDPDEADAMGAFRETALGADDAWEANADMGEDHGG